MSGFLSNKPHQTWKGKITFTVLSFLSNSVNSIKYFYTT